ncbi:MAG: hydantoinase/oxoprolinase N-terminal domain-containing protein [Rhizobiaceae bacterium]
MALLLGIDTGGTFTDAAILDDTLPPAKAVVAKAKALTSRPDLSIGIGGAVRTVIEQFACKAEDIRLVSLSTTLATNALVEGQGERVALIAIGFDERDMRKAGLDTALGIDPLVLLPGGHTTHGAEAAALEMSALKEQLDQLSGTVAGFAVAGYFAVRNPIHERAVADLIIERTGKPVTCSHELSANLNGPKRALTTVLNARLIPMIARLIEATQRTLEGAGITAPLMVVRGDGALVGADFAHRRPIETILSGPAASLVGAHFLTGLDHAIINDVGGTTSDVALLEDGKPTLDPQGALVGGYRTMVEAVAMHTFGLGGDSEVALVGSTLQPQIALGPSRVVPICLSAKDHPEIVHEALDAQMKSALPHRYDGRFAFRLSAGKTSGLSTSDRRLFEKLSTAPATLNTLLDGHAQSAALSRLVARGLVQISALTPSDALHAIGEQEGWDREAALKVLNLFGRRREGSGQPYCTDPRQLAKRIITRMRRRSAEAVLETALATGGKDPVLTYHPLMSDILDRRENKPADASVIDMSLKLDRPLIGLGASAHAWHPQAAELLGTHAVVPDHAGVANAVGAVVGRISVSARVTISQPSEGRFHVTGTEQPFASEDIAYVEAEELARSDAEKLAQQAGAGMFQIAVSRAEKRADFEGRNMLVEAVVTATATGRPAISGG